LLGDRHALRLEVVEGIHPGVGHVALQLVELSVILDGAAVLRLRGLETLHQFLA
jgi:hypothetical protein